MRKKILINTFYKYIFLTLLISCLVVSYQFFDIDRIGNLFQNAESEIGSISLSVISLILFLRLISIIIPILPGTYCSVIAGYLFGFKVGFLLICLADFIACSSSFFLSRKLGRDFVGNLLGSKQMQRIEKISINNIENNFFLMTGLLMTQFFDFVCYAVGLTKVSWKKFMPALIISIMISDAPFVAGGFSIRQLGSFSINEILNGEVKTLAGAPLVIFIASVSIIFSLAFISKYLNKK